MAQRHQPAVDLGADAGIADAGMHRIGKIDGRAAAWQRHQLALGGETEHLVVEHGQLGVLEKFFRRRGLLENLQKFLYPAILGTIHLLRALLVAPMRGNAVFRHFVHFPGADLYFDAQLARPDHRGVERAIAVALAHRDVILETPGHHRPLGVDNPQRLVAGRNIADDHAKGHHIGQLLERHMVALHLVPDGIGGLFAARYLGLQSRL